ncbi:hypothetical protein HY448_01490 [Candidatus Pacearchaeota archaeon]|nr:hypothetical protein [Candidatus Pacearchaeota archaeon]
MNNENRRLRNEIYAFFGDIADLPNAEGLLKESFKAISERCIPIVVHTRSQELIDLLRYYGNKIFREEEGFDDYLSALVKENEVDNIKPH